MGQVTDYKSLKLRLSVSVSVIAHTAAIFIWFS